MEKAEGFEACDGMEMVMIIGECVILVENIIEKTKIHMAIPTINETGWLQQDGKIRV